MGDPTSEELRSFRDSIGKVLLSRNHAMEAAANGLLARPVCVTWRKFLTIQLAGIVGLGER